jgi:hypothetical protein
MPTVGPRQKSLAQTGIVPRSLACDAASSAIEFGQLEAAVELLEKGRATLWSQLRGYRHPLEELRDIDEELADRFEFVSGELERLVMSSDTESMAKPLGFLRQEIAETSYSFRVGHARGENSKNRRVCKLPASHTIHYSPIGCYGWPHDSREHQPISF